jgi:hypothetical protein
MTPKKHTTKSHETNPLRRFYVTVGTAPWLAKFSKLLEKSLLNFASQKVFLYVSFGTHTGHRITVQ